MMVKKSFFIAALIITMLPIHYAEAATIIEQPTAADMVEQYYNALNVANPNLELARIAIFFLATGTALNEDGEQIADYGITNKRSWLPDEAESYDNLLKVAVPLYNQLKQANPDKSLSFDLLMVGKSSMEQAHIKVVQRRIQELTPISVVVPATTAPLAAPTRMRTKCRGPGTHCGKGRHHHRRNKDK